MMKLKDKSNMFVPEITKLLFIQRKNILTLYQNRTLIRLIQSSDDMK
ncbi:Uncharacterised protein [Mycobacterium tuberculosis]|nr:Uncharacterised protein [Mycobacterium tuberculosis]